MWPRDEGRMDENTEKLGDGSSGTETGEKPQDIKARRGRVGRQRSDDF